MKGKEILRLVDSLHKNKSIDAEIIFQAIESALQSAARKHFGATDDASVHIDRQSGEVEATIGGKPVDPEALGRIAAQTAKQIITQRIRQAESEIIYQEYTGQKGALVTGAVQRFEGSSIIVNLERTEATLPRSEQIPGEHYQPGERIRAVILDVRKSPDQAMIILSRTHQDFVRRLFELEVPEVAEGVVVIRRMAREPGLRTKVAMESLEAHVDCIGACVGVRGTRIKSIIDELNGEKIDIVPWREAPEMLIADSLKPAEVIQMTLEEGEYTKRAIVTVPEDQLALAIGRKGQNVRLAAKLTGWDIDIQPPEAPALGQPAAGAPDEQKADAVSPQPGEATSEADRVQLDQDMPDSSAPPVGDAEPEPAVSSLEATDAPAGPAAAEGEDTTPVEEGPSRQT
jgi:N utilization substance protein A